jgi:hypothetical protein
MESVTEREISTTAVAAMAKHAFDSEPCSVKKIFRDFYSTVFQVILKDGKNLILNIAPDDGIKAMRTEKGLFQSEVAAIKKISEFKYVPVSHTVFYDSSREIANREYFFVEMLEGTSLNKVNDRLPLSKLADLYTQVGIYAFKINSITGKFYGSLFDENKRFNSWGKAFYSMVDDALCDAADFNVPLPFEHDHFRRRVENERMLLDDVKAPSLLHNRLSIENVLVDTQNSEITGIVNCKRAIFGDALMEPVCGGLIDNENFVCSYNSGRPFNSSQWLRMSLYRIYSGIICSLELSRVPDIRLEKFAKEQLQKGICEYQKYKSMPF